MPRYTMRKNLVSIGGDYTIQDEQGEDAYTVDGKIRFAKTFVLRDREGNEVARGVEKLLTIDVTLHIQRAGETIATVRRVHLSSTRYKFVIDVKDGGGLEARGVFYEDDYRLLRGEALVATVKQTRLELRESYDIDVMSGEDDALVLAIAAAIVALFPDTTIGDP